MKNKKTPSFDSNAPFKEECAPLNNSVKKTLFFASLFLFLFLVVDIGNFIYRFNEITTQASARVEAVEYAIFLLSLFLLLVFNFFFIKYIKSRYKAKPKKKTILLSLSWFFLLIRVLGFLFFFIAVIIGLTGSTTDGASDLVLFLLIFYTYVRFLSFVIAVFYIITIAMFVCKNKAEIKLKEQNQQKDSKNN